MAFTTDMTRAATRHFKDGKLLQDHACIDNAGYHYGFATECALKQALINCGVRLDDGAIWAHFPKLRELGLLAIRSRQGKGLYNLLNDSAYMQYWDTTMRYADNGSISQAQAEKWKNDANRALGLLL